MFEFEGLTHTADLVVQIQRAEQGTAGTYNGGKAPIQFAVIVQGLSGDLLPGVAIEEKDFQQIIQEIQEVKPDVIINTLNGDSNEYFFKQLYQEGLSANDYPIMSFSISENEISTIGAEYLKGQYVSWSYFATSDSSKSRQFVSRYREKFGGEKRVGEPIEAGYLSVFLWASACEKAGSFDIEAVRIAAKNLSYIAPEGFVTIEGSNQHLNKYARIGRIAEDGSINQVWSTENPVRPDPYLSTYAWARGL